MVGRLKRGDAMTILILLAATAAIWVAVGNPRALLRREDYFTVVWVFFVAAWPFIIIYGVGPLIWVSSASPSPAPGTHTLAGALEYTPAAICSLVALVRGLREPRVEVSLPAALIGTLLVFAAVAVWFSGLTQVLNFMMNGALFMGVVLKRGVTPVRTLSVAALVSLATLSAAVTLAVIVNPGRVVEHCRTDKCGVTTQVLTSPLAGNGNALGIATVLLITFACASLTLWRCLVLLAGVGAVQLVAMSRTAIFALVTVSVALLLIKVSKTLQWRLRVAFTALAVGFCGSVYPLFVNFSGSSFSGRGYVWQAGRDAIGQAPVFGHGPSYWWSIAQNALFDANYSPHNGWYDLLIAVGVWGVLVIIVGVIVQLSMTARAALPYLVTYYACVLSINMFESVYVPYFLGILPIAALLPLMLYDPKSAADRELEANLVAFDRAGSE
jgi:exopolysaccharide production protein ExoQ